MSVIPERPKSVDSHEEARKTYLREIDYTGSIMYSEVLRRNSLKASKQMSGGVGKQMSGGAGEQMSGAKNVEDIAEHKEEDEDEQYTLTMPGGSKKSKLKSYLELQNQESAISLNKGPMEAENDQCYSQIEMEYLRSLLKNKSALAAASKENNLDAIYTKARKTLKASMKKLLLKR